MPLFSQAAAADVFWFVRNDDGSTNWQYVANFSSGILIIALSLTILRLFFTRRQVRQYNRELEEIRTQLELRVKERTATLEDEIVEHRSTTERLRSSESYITSILRSMPLMLIGLSKENHITQWNHRAEEISGLPSASVMGQDLWEAFPSISVTPQQIQQALDDNETLTIKYSQRGQYHFDITIYPLQNQMETGVVILVDDVTQRVQNETMLIQRDKMSSMGEMASIMAHDINIPLRAIIKDVKEVRQDLTDEPMDVEGMREMLENAVIRGQQATSIIDNLVNFSGGGGGTKTEANMVDVINHSVELANDVLSVMPGLRFKDVKVNIDCPDDVPEIPCYITEMQQVFLSLFRHSCYALGASRRSATICRLSILKSRCSTIICGCVFSTMAAVLAWRSRKTIFEPFAADGDDSGQFGPGKRLSFSHFIVVEQHQGQIAVTSDPDVGTTFHIQLPLR